MMKNAIGPGEVYWFGDDLGMQSGLAMGATQWRKYLRPCFAEIFGAWRAAGRLVYFHTDGCIWEIIPDLIDCGVQIINPQFRANGIDNLVRSAKGKVCIDLDLDRQLMPFCSPGDVDAHVRECVQKLATPEGGLWIKAELAPDIPLPNIEALFAALRRWR